MSDVASLIADMVRAGVDPDLIGRAAAALAEREPVKIEDEQALRKRAADRDRMRRKREESRATSRDIRDVADLLSPEGSSPTPPSPKPLSSIPPSPPKGGSSPAGFDEFWSAYPNKVGKRDAEKAFSKAIRRASVDEIMAGLLRYAAKSDDRPWCNPATFLNQDRWGDQPAPVAHSPPRQREQSMADYVGDLLRNVKNGTDTDFAGPTVEASYSAGDHRTHGTAFRLTSDEGRR